jgi:hypothetical protein
MIIGPKALINLGYPRALAEIASRAGLGGAGNPPPLPDGYVFYVDLDGAYLIDNDGNFMIGPA